MNTYPLVKFDNWDDFDRIVFALQKIGWSIEQNIDGPDARVCLLERNGQQVWLVFDDVLGCLLKNENVLSELKLIAEELNDVLFENEKINITQKWGQATNLDRN